MAALVAIGILVWYASQTRQTSRLARYRAELRERGEKLTYAELKSASPEDFPGAFDPFLSAVGKLEDPEFSPWRYIAGWFSASRPYEITWRMPTPPRDPKDSKTNDLTWGGLAAGMNAKALELEHLRAVLAQVPISFGQESTNLVNGPVRLLRPMQVAAYWLFADVMTAMRLEDKPRAKADILALSHLGRISGQDPNLLAQMLQSAMAEFGLRATWEILQEPGWREGDFAELQAAWETMDFVRALEVGLEGDRAWGAFVFGRYRQGRSEARALFEGVDPTTWGGRLRTEFLTSYWQLHADADEIRMLEYFQSFLDGVREIKTRGVTAEVRNALKKKDREREYVYKHRASYLLTPGIPKITAGLVNREILRRLTVTALALERCRIRRGNYPETLAELSPEFIQEVMRDPIDLNPLRYRRNSDGSFVLYSIGNNGKDEGGDSSLLGIDLWTDKRVGTNDFSLGNRRDAVWPTSPK